MQRWIKRCRPASLILPICRNSSEVTIEEYIRITVCNDLPRHYMSCPLVFQFASHRNDTPFHWTDVGRSTVQISEILMSKIRRRLWFQLACSNDRVGNPSTIEHHTAACTFFSCIEYTFSPCGQNKLVYI